MQKHMVFYVFATSAPCFLRYPRWSQDGSRSRPRGPKRGPRASKMAPRAAQGGPKQGPRRPQDGSLAAQVHQVASKMPPSCHLAGHVSPSCLQVASKMAPIGPKRPPRGPNTSLHLGPQIVGDGGGGHSPSGVLDNNNITPKCVNITVSSICV